MTDKPALIASGLTKAYAGRAIVAAASLTLQPGQVTALVGHSGAGKTTLLRLLAGMERPGTGTIHSGNTALSTPTHHVPPEQRRIGLIFQDFALFPHLDVAKNIAFGLSHIARDERAAITARWLDALNLNPRRSAFPHQLSGGEQQRVAIARALAPGPVAILMDEPFSGLDPVLRCQAREVALSAIRAAQTPALLVTHDTSEALGHADQIAIMNEGRILQTDTPEAVYSRPVSLAAAAALGPVQTIRRSALPAPWQTQLPDGETLYLRPEAIQIDPQSATTLSVKHARRLGALTAVTFTAEGNDLQASMIMPQTPAAGDTIRVSLNPASVFAFPAKAS